MDAVCSVKHASLFATGVGDGLPSRGSSRTRPLRRYHPAARRPPGAARGAAHATVACASATGRAVPLMSCPSRTSRRLTVSGLRRALGLLAILAVVPATGCTSKKLTTGGAVDSFFYGLLGMDRDTAYYFNVVQRAHHPTTFCYRCTDDPYLADKCVDAIIHLGKANYSRLEGEAQVIVLLSDVLIEDPAALAKDRAAAALTLLGTKVPVRAAVPRTARGENWHKQVQ